MDQMRKESFLLEGKQALHSCAACCHKVYLVSMLACLHAYLVNRFDSTFYFSHCPQATTAGTTVDLSDTTA